MKNLFTKLLIAGFLGIGYFSNAQITCNQLIQTALSDAGIVTLYPEFILEGNQNGNFEISADNVTFEPFITFDCTNIGSNIAYVRNANTGNVCWGEVIVEDKLRPVPYAISISTAIPDPSTCSVELWATDFSINSFDNCEIITYSFGQNGYLPLDTLINDTLINLSVPHYYNDQGEIIDDNTPSQLVLDQYAAGQVMRWDPISKSGARMYFPGDNQVVSMTVTDPSGLNNYALVALNVTPCNSGSPICLNNITIGTDTWNPITSVLASTFVSGNVQNVEASLDQSNYAPTIELSCTDVEMDKDLFLRYSFDGQTETCQVKFNFLDQTPPVAIADQQISVQLADFNDEVTISVDQVDEGSYDICGIANRTLSKYTFNMNDIGVNVVILTIEDVNGNFGSVQSEVVVSVNGGCNFTESDIIWPDEVIQINTPNIDPTSLSPENLIANYGFGAHQVEPSVSVSCDFLSKTYSDVVIDLPLGMNNYFKIIRSWVVLNWHTGEVFTFDHLIKNTPNQSNFICDFLPRIAPIGDCASGHTLDDDVEWPNDILIDDHRISPAELVAISNVDPLDASPSYYNEPNQYAHSYEDILIDLSPSEIELGRRWTVTRLDNGFTYNYTQLVAIDISGFGNLVTVSDPIGRAVQGVEINGNIFTDDRGRAMVMEDLASINKKDISLKGLTLRDVYLMQEQVLNKRELDEIGLLAGDLNESGEISTLDVALFVRHLLGISDPSDYEDLGFVNAQDFDNESLKPKAAYISYKYGDVDHTYISGENIQILNDAITFEDQILNAGESYTIPIYLNTDVELQGLHINNISFDNDLITYQGIFSAVSTDQAFTNNAQGGINALISFGNTEDAFSMGDAIIYIDIFAKENTLLSEVLDFSLAEATILANETQLYSSGLEVRNVIITPTFEISDKTYTLNVFPNPSSDVVNFKLDNDFSIQSIRIINMAGQELLKVKDQNSIRVNELDNGIYIYQVQLESEFISGRIEVFTP